MVQVPLVMFLLTLPVDGNYSQPPLEKIVALFALREIMKINFFFASQKREVFVEVNTQIFADVCF